VVVKGGGRPGEGFPKALLQLAHGGQAQVIVVVVRDEDKVHVGERRVVQGEWRPHHPPAREVSLEFPPTPSVRNPDNLSCPILMCMMCHSEPPCSGLCSEQKAKSPQGSQAARH